MAAGLLILWASLAQAAAPHAAPARVEAQTVRQRPAVLVLFGDDPSQPWIQPMSDAISRVLYGQGTESPEPYYEYLDAIRFPIGCIAICFETRFDGSTATSAST